MTHRGIRCTGWIKNIGRSSPFAAGFNLQSFKKSENRSFGSVSFSTRLQILL